MSTNKKIFLSIIFLVLIPCKVIFAQDVQSSDTAVQTQLDIEYDSVLAKAASSLTSSAFEESINYYKKAGELKPGETYPYKMIKYVEALAEKQKHADDLKRKAQIKSDLIKANQAIVSKNWDSAKIYFNEVLALHPEKPDEDFARSKVAAIDLELQRIASRTPVKEVPKPVIVPKNKREARALRKLAERNAILASAANKAISQKQIVTKPDSAILPSDQKNKNAVTSVGASTSAAPAKNKINYQLLNHFNEDFKDAKDINWTMTSEFAKVNFLQYDEKVEAFYDLDGGLIGTTRFITIDQIPREARRIFATKYANYNIKEVIRYEGAEDVAYYIHAEDDKEKLIFKLSGSRDISLFSRESVAKGAQPPVATKTMPEKKIDTPLPETKVAGTMDSPKTNITQATPIQTPAQAKIEAMAATSTNNPDPKSTQVQPSSQANTLPPGSKTQPKPTEPPLATKTGTLSAAAKEIPQAASIAKGAVIPALPSGKENQFKPTGATFSNKVIAPPQNKAIEQNQVQNQESILPNHNIPAPSVQETPPETIEGHSLKLYDSSDYVKMICQDISFIGSNAYIKVLIQNYSPTIEFLTDTLHVSIKKNNGTIKKLDQRFVSNFPVIKPLDESVLVSLADAAVNVEPDDIFIIEMKDKMRRTKLTVQVPWRLYTQSKAF
ncbi:hypothetical protein [Segetibacter koreensis]|uniref:hypothetical protein n=1 Tax=Segetibacter koreensis TaxID=398037 RepID=UPI00037DBD79|nr:hypothetical protein [Segetibacter koreensis]